ncbi:MAG TPA: FAD/NAD(P)-binding protein [Acetobacteraceae bacterium]|nr:FAD/NAD(P)-binding protein [Acetobacteraceae bacterium]HUN51308.1 FAD/NAD(P)-binding protein [Candidatus Sulfotelmatobacter sp.]
MRKRPQAGPARRRIGIVGAGFSGTMLAVHLLHELRAPADIFLFDRAGAFGRGLAYSTRNPQHLLNARVANMSAFNDDPQHFIRWLWADDDALGYSLSVPPTGHAFVSRATYGAYLADVLREASGESRHGAALHRLASDVVGLRREGDGLRLDCADGPAMAVDQAVLCVGNFPRVAPFEPAALLNASPRFIADPWDDTAFARIGPDDAVVLVGTGLTMVDVAIDLVSRGHRAPLRAFSQRGLTPAVHQQTRTYPVFFDRRRLPASVLQQLRLVRREVQRGAAAGYDWRSVLDAIRPLVQDLWRVLPLAERRRFLRHLRPYWDVHRHRMAPDNANQLAKLSRAGRLVTTAARTDTVIVEEEQIILALKPRGGSDRFIWRADWLVNCSGPECDYRRIDHPLIRCLLDSALARPDPLNLGLDVGADFAVVAADGQPSPVLYALGPPTRGALWEITAVPDIRAQCATLAAALAGTTPNKHENNVIVL